MNGGDSRAHLGFGSFEEGVQWEGRSLPARPCSDPVNHPQIKVYAGLVQDANRAYWDEDWATSCWGGVLSPPGMLMVWSWPLAWVPEHVQTFPPMLASLVPLPGDRVVNASSRTSFTRPVCVGERLTVEETVTAVSQERRTALGPGHFVTTEAVYRLADGTPVANHGNTMLRYTAVTPDNEPTASESVPSEDTTAPIAEPERPRPGTRVPGISLDVTLETCVHDVAATRDFLPAHYDAAYARSSGAPQPFLNTMFNHGFIDRVCTDWAGPLSRVVRRDVRFHSPVYAGSDLHGSGRVVDTIEQQDGSRVVGLDVVLQSGPRLAATARCHVLIGAAPTDLRSSSPHYERVI